MRQKGHRRPHSDAGILELMKSTQVTGMEAGGERVRHLGVGASVNSLNPRVRALMGPVSPLPPQLPIESVVVRTGVEVPWATRRACSLERPWEACVAGL